MYCKYDLMLQQDRADTTGTVQVNENVQVRNVDIRELGRS